MATYNYTCTNEECEQNDFTFMRSMNECHEPAPCPKCEKLSPRKANDWCRNFQLKGAGWYRDGYVGAPAHSESLKAGKDPYKAN